MERESFLSRHETTSKHETIVVAFLKEAILEGAHLKTPPGLSEDQWIRQRNIGGAYHGSPSATLKDVGERYGITEERVRQISYAFLTNLWNNVSKEKKDRHPLNELRTARKTRSQRSREIYSARHGGISLRIKEELEKGITDINTININTGIPIVIILRSRYTLKRWGIDLPRKRHLYEETLRQLENENDDKTSQELLDQLPYTTIRDYIGKKKEPRLFYSLLTLVREAGFHLKNKETHFFAGSLQKAEVPMTRKDIVVQGTRPHIATYYILLLRDKDRVTKVLREDQDLQRFLINPVSGLWKRG